MLPDLRDFASALIVKPSSLGDIVHTLPSVRAIRASYPHLKLRWIAKPEWLPLINGSPDIDETIPFPQREFRGLTGKARGLAWAARWNKAPREEPEIVLDFQGLLRSALICRARGSFPVVGLSDAREGALSFYDHTIQVDAGAHAVDRYLCLPQALGAAIDDVQFPLPAGEPVTVAVPERFVLVHPWSRGAGKSLGEHELQVLCECMSLPVVLVGVHRSPPQIRGANVLNLANQTTLAQLLWLMQRAAFTISVDSGPMHMAAAVSDAALGIHTWSDPRKVGPYNPRAWVWKAGRIGHRTEFSAAECTQETAFHEGDARRVADHALRYVR